MKHEETPKQMIQRVVRVAQILAEGSRKTAPEKPKTHKTDKSV